MNKLLSLIKLILCLFIINFLNACSMNLLNLHTGNDKSREVFKLAWRVDKLHSIKNEVQKFKPAIDNNIVYACDAEGKILKLDISDGTIIKTINLNKPLSSCIAVSENNLLATTDDAKLLYIDKISNNIIREVALPTLSLEPPKTISNMALVKTNDSWLFNYIFNHDTMNANLLWAYEHKQSILSLRLYDTFTIIEPDLVLTTVPNGGLSLLNLLTGSVIWNITVALPQGANDIDKLTDVVVAPVVANRETCLLSYNNKLSCFDLLNGNLLWDKQIVSNTNILLDDKSVYVLTTDGKIDAFDSSTGVFLWENKDFMNPKAITLLSLLSDKLVLIDENSYIHLLNISTGRKMATIPSSIAQPLSVLNINNQSIIIQDKNAIISKYTILE